MFNPFVNSRFETYSSRGGLLVLSGIMLNGAISGSLMRLSRVNQDKTVESNKPRNSEYDKENKLIGERSNRKDTSNREFILQNSDKIKLAQTKHYLLYCYIELGLI